MRKIILLSAGIILAGAIGYFVYSLSTTKSHSPAATAQYENNGLSVKIDYCRPYKKGRLLFGPEGSGALEQYNEPWRTGANEATEISTNKDLKFDTGVLKSGQYSIYTIPGETDWTVVFNSKTKYWGASPMGSPFEEDLDVLRVTVPRDKNDNLTEQLTININDDNDQMKILLLWDDIKVLVPFEVQS